VARPRPPVCAHRRLCSPRDKGTCHRRARRPSGSARWRPPRAGRVCDYPVALAYRVGNACLLTSKKRMGRLSYCKSLAFALMPEAPGLSSTLNSPSGCDRTVQRYMRNRRLRPKTLRRRKPSGRRSLLGENSACWRARGGALRIRTWHISDVTRESKRGLLVVVRAVVHACGRNHLNATLSCRWKSEVIGSSPLRCSHAERARSSPNEGDKSPPVIGAIAGQ
jgi:hypothetical protein